MSRSLMFSVFAAGAAFLPLAQVHAKYSLEFEPLSLPATDEEKSVFRVSPKAIITDARGRKKTYPLSFDILYRSGWTDYRGVTAGTLMNLQGKPILSEGVVRISPKPDGNTVLTTASGPVLITQFEDRPSAVYAAPLAMRKNGTLRPLLFHNLDLSSIGGLQHTCAASRTPWNTHLLPEEDYELEAFFFDPATKPFTPNHIAYCNQDAAGRLTGGYTAPAAFPGANHAGWCGDVFGTRDQLHGDPKKFNPYRFGYMLEIAAGPSRKPRIRYGHKLFAFGKATPEMGLVMPDSRTVYGTDDGDYRGFYMFRAARPKDLRSGVLYMARFHQKPGDPRAGSLTWVRLGSGHSAEIKRLVDRRLVFTDIFDVQDPKACPKEKGFRLLAAGDPAKMCLRLRDGKWSKRSPKLHSAREVRLAAAFLEKRKYGAYLGATAEFVKLEGITLDPHGKRLFMSISSVDSSMEDNSRSDETANHIRMPKNSCGAVYEIRLGAQKGMPGAWNGLSMTPLIEGRPLKPGEPYANENACHPDSIANPDNLRFFPGSDTILVGEDTSKHFNNAVFAVNVRTRKLTRIFTIPTGGETAGAFAPLTWKGKSYVFINSQYPLAGGANNAAGENVNKTLVEKAPKHLQSGVIGYLRGLPALPGL